ncbi:unnamed protein product, partial [Pylaiella littoralis]
MNLVSCQFTFIVFYSAWASSQSSAYCISDDASPAVGYMMGSEAINWMASSADSTTLAVTSVNFDGSENQHHLTLFDASTNDDDTLSQAGSVIESFNSVSAALYPAAVTFSGDDQHLYVYYPETTTLRKHDVDNIYTGQSSITTGGDLDNPCHFIGMSDQDDFLILVDSGNIYTFERAVDGSLSLYQTTGVPTAGYSISSATTDSTRDWLLIVAFQTMFSYKVMDGTPELSQVVIVFTGSGTFEDSAYIAITADSTSVYLEATDNGGLVLMDMTVDSMSGNLTLGGTSTEIQSHRADFATAHPDNSVLYTGKIDDGEYREYNRDDADGSLTSTCSDVDEDDDIYNRLLVSPDWMHVYAAGRNIVRAYSTHTESPHTPSPTASPVPSVVQDTPSPTRAPTTAPTIAATPGPTIAPTPAATTAATPVPSIAPTPVPTTAPTTGPTKGPTPSPAVSSVDSLPPEMISAELSDTNSSFVLTF